MTVDDMSSVAAPGEPWCGVTEASGRWPMSVTVLDAEDLPAAIDGDRGDVVYRYASFVVRVAGRPVAVRCEPFGEDHQIAADALWGPLRGIAEHRGAPLLVAAELPAVTIVVCTTFDRPEALRRCLRSLASLDGTPCEVVVVDNAARTTSAVRALRGEVAAMRGVRLLGEPRRGLAAARNCGLRAAHGTYVAFTDDDVVVDRLWLRALASRLVAHPEEIGVCGMVLPLDLRTSAQVRLECYRGGFGPRGMRAESRAMGRRSGIAALLDPRVQTVDATGRVVASESLYRVGQFGVGANMAFRTSALREAGGFDTRLGAGTPACGGEDIELFVRVVWRGARIGYEPAAIVLHEHRGDEDALRAQMRQYGTGFTAALTALVARDPRHAAAMLATILELGLRRSTPHSRSPSERGRRRRRLRGGDGGYADLERLEFTGMLRGVDAFLRSWMHARRA